jgi:hypothetical protein
VQHREKHLEAAYGPHGVWNVGRHQDGLPRTKPARVSTDHKLALAVKDLDEPASVLSSERLTTAPWPYWTSSARESGSVAGTSLIDVFCVAMAGALSFMSVVNGPSAGGPDASAGSGVTCGVSRAGQRS